MKLLIIVWDAGVQLSRVSRLGWIFPVGMAALMYGSVAAIAAALMPEIKAPFTELRIQRVKRANVTQLSDVRRRRELSAVMNLGRRR